MRLIPQNQRMLSVKYFILLYYYYMLCKYSVFVSVCGVFVCCTFALCQHVSFQKFDQGGDIIKNG